MYKKRPMQGFSMQLRELRLYFNRKMIIFSKERSNRTAMTLFRNKYRVETIRAQWWDYTSNGTYFIRSAQKTDTIFLERSGTAKWNCRI